MILQLENTNQENINKLIAFALQNNMKLKPVDESNNFVLPGRPLTSIELKELIESGRTSGKISMENAHKIIRSKFNEC